MRSAGAEAAFSAARWDDRPGRGCPAICTGLPAGRRAGSGVRFSPPAAHPSPAYRRPAVRAGSFLGMAVSGLCGVCRRHSAGLCGRSGGGGAGVGRHGRQGAAAGIWLGVENFRAGMGASGLSGEKIIENLHQNEKKTICNRRKMGYNNTESRPKEKGRYCRWKTERSAWFSAGAVWP